MQHSGNVNLSDQLDDDALERRFGPRLLKAVRIADPHATREPGHEEVLAGVRMRFVASKDSAPTITEVVSRAMGHHPHRLTITDREQDVRVVVTVGRLPKVPLWGYLIFLLLVTTLTLTGLHRLFSAPN